MHQNTIQLPECRLIHPDECCDRCAISRLASRMIALLGWLKQRSHQPANASEIVMFK
jgi:hypothetical protein